jgi:hypothetical protein
VILRRVIAARDALVVPVSVGTFCKGWRIDRSAPFMITARLRMDLEAKGEGAGVLDFR